MSELTKVERLKIIREQLKALKADNTDVNELKDIIRDVREVTASIWYSQDWNESSIDC